MDPAAAAARPQPPAVQAPASATAVRFTPLLGVDGRQPLSYMLELDGFTLLLDCGWDDSYDPALLAPLLAALPRVDAGAGGPRLAAPGLGLGWQGSWRLLALCSQHCAPDCRRLARSPVMLPCRRRVAVQHHAVLLSCCIPSNSPCTHRPQCC